MNIHLTPFENHNNISQQQTGGGRASSKYVGPPNNQPNNNRNEKRKDKTDRFERRRTVCRRSKTSPTRRPTPTSDRHSRPSPLLLLFRRENDQNTHTTRNTFFFISFLYNFTLESNGRTRQFNPIIFWPQSKFLNYQSLHEIQSAGQRVFRLLFFLNYFLGNTTTHNNNKKTIVNFKFFPSQFKTGLAGTGTAARSSFIADETFTQHSTCCRCCCCC